MRAFSDQPSWLRGVSWPLVGMVAAIAVMQNVPQFILAMLATWKAGGVMVSINPVMWNSGATPSTESSGVSAIQFRYAVELNTTLPWVFIAPLGSPVVPEV